MNSIIITYYHIRDFYSWLVTYITSRHPLSFIVFILFFIKGWSSREVMLTLLTATMIIEYAIRHISNFYTIKNCYKDLETKISRKIISNTKLVDSKLLQLFADTAAKVQMNPIFYFFPPTFTFYKALDYHQYSTYPINSKSAIILLKQTFDENEPIDRDALAHECGHAFHSQFRSTRFEIPVALIIFSLLLFFYAIFFNYRQGLYLLLVFTIPFLTQIFTYKSRIESEAEDTALKIIETLYGPEEMRQTAKRLINLRMQEVRRSKQPSNKLVSYLSAIKHLAYYLDETTASKIQEKTQNNISSLSSKDDEYSRGRLILENEFNYILQLPKRQTSLAYKLRPSWFYIIFLSISLFGTAFISFKIFSETQNFSLLENYSTTIAICTLCIAIIIGIPATIKSFKLCKNIKIIINQIGH